MYSCILPLGGTKLHSQRSHHCPMPQMSVHTVDSNSSNPHPIHAFIHSNSLILYRRSHTLLPDSRVHSSWTLIHIPDAPTPSAKRNLSKFTTLKPDSMCPQFFPVGTYTQAQIQAVPASFAKRNLLTQTEDGRTPQFNATKQFFSASGTTTSLSLLVSIYVCLSQKDTLTHSLRVSELRTTHTLSDIQTRASIM